MNTKSTLAILIAALLSAPGALMAAPGGAGGPTRVQSQQGFHTQSQHQQQVREQLQNQEQMQLQNQEQYRLRDQSGQTSGATAEDVSVSGDQDRDQLRDRDRLQEPDQLQDQDRTRDRIHQDQ